MDVIVRKAEPADAALLAELNFQFNGVHIAAGQISNSLQHNRSETVFIAIADTQPVGFVSVNLLFSFCYDNPTAEITELFVQQGFRRLGVGKRLLDSVKTYAEDSNVSELSLKTNIKNQVAQVFYESLGFIRAENSLYKITM